MPPTLHLTNDIRQVPHLAAWVEQLAEECQLPPALTLQLQLALEEAVVNVMQYAYPGQEGRPITLTAQPAADAISFTLIDEGIPFDPTQATPPDLTLPAQDRPVGGLGIMLVRHIMTHVAYSRAHGCNHLSMTISIPHP